MLRTAAFQPVQLSWQSARLLSAWSWVRAPRWVLLLFSSCMTHIFFQDLETAGSIFTTYRGFFCVFVFLLILFTFDATSHSLPICQRPVIFQRNCQKTRLPSFLCAKNMKECRVQSGVLAKKQKFSFSQSYQEELQAKNCIVLKFYIKCMYTVYYIYLEAIVPSMFE